MIPTSRHLNIYAGNTFYSSLPRKSVSYITYGGVGAYHQWWGGCLSPMAGLVLSAMELLRKSHVGDGLYHLHFL